MEYRQFRTVTSQTPTRTFKVTGFHVIDVLDIIFEKQSPISFVLNLKPHIYIRMHRASININNP